MVSSSLYFSECRQLLGRNCLILVLSLIVLVCQVGAAPSSFYPMGAETPNARNRLMSLFPPVTSYNNAATNRKMIRSYALNGRNCFFSPVQCHISKAPIGGSDSSMRRRRRILSGSAAPMFEDYASIPRFRREFVDYAY